MLGLVKNIVIFILITVVGNIFPAVKQFGNNMAKKGVVEVKVFLRRKNDCTIIWPGIGEVISSKPGLPAAFPRPEQEMEPYTEYLERMRKLGYSLIDKLVWWEQESMQSGMCDQRINCSLIFERR